MVAVGLAVGLAGVGVLALAVYLGRYGLRRVRRLGRLVRTPTSEVRSLDPHGSVKLWGTAQSPSAFESPIGERECVVAVWRVERWTPSKYSSGWSTVESGVYVAPFRLDDGTGQVTVDLRERSDDGAVASRYPDWLNGAGEIDPGVHWQFGDPVEVTRHPPDEMPSRLATLTDAAGMPSPAGALSVDLVAERGTRRYLEWVLEPGDEVFVLGRPHPRPGAARPFRPDDLAVRPSADGPVVVSNRREAALRRRFRNRTLLLPVALVLSVAGVVTVLGALVLPEFYLVLLLGGFAILLPFVVLGLEAL